MGKNVMKTAFFAKFLFLFFTVQKMLTDKATAEVEDWRKAP